MKLMRTIRLDPSDTFVFERAAEPGEWATPGAFVFWNADPERLAGKARSAFRAGFLGLDSFGWSTLVQVVEASAADCAAAIELLAQRLMENCGAPDINVARTAASEEINAAALLCQHPRDTLIALHRRVEDGDIREQFRTLRPREGVRPLRAFSFLDVEGEDEPDETVDLSALAQERR